LKSADSSTKIAKPEPVPVIKETKESDGHVCNKRDERRGTKLVGINA
jgi:hypothetical protein